MSTKTLDNLMQQAVSLTVDEQLLLASYLVDRVRMAYPQSVARRKWREIRGRSQALLTGEDAQAWVSRTRREADEQREQSRRSVL